MRSVPYSLQLPASAAWSHHDSRIGFEAVAIDQSADGWTLSGSTTAIEDGLTWHVAYRIEIDRRSVTRNARIRTQSGHQCQRTLLEHDGSGRWSIDTQAAPQLDGCLDVDLESSALTNAFPVRRFIAEGRWGVEAVPVAYVRVHSPHIERLEQQYQRLPDTCNTAFTFDYRAPIFDFSCHITYDTAGLVTNYPTIAVRSL
jgi:hypothetical protein